MNFYLVGAHGNLDILTADQLMPERKSKSKYYNNGYWGSHSFKRSFYRPDVFYVVAGKFEYVCGDIFEDCHNVEGHLGSKHSIESHQSFFLILFLLLIHILILVLLLLLMVTYHHDPPGRPPCSARPPWRGSGAPALPGELGTTSFDPAAMWS